MSEEMEGTGFIHGQMSLTDGMKLCCKGSCKVIIKLDHSRFIGQKKLSYLGQGVPVLLEPEECQTLLTLVMCTQDAHLPFCLPRMTCCGGRAPGRRCGLAVK